MKKLAARLFARWIHKKNQRWIQNPLKAQEATFNTLINKAQNTAFGKDHNFNQISDYESFKKNIPLRNYEDLRPYIDRVVNGEENVLFLAKSRYILY